MLFPVKELMRVVKTVADQIEVHGPKTKLSLKKVAEHASSAERVIISASARDSVLQSAVGASRRVRGALFTATIRQSTTVGF
jgi:hypothetical protein